MGFRSTLTSLDASHVVWPGWFREKYADLLSRDGRERDVDDRRPRVLRTDHAHKTYGEALRELPEDVRAALLEIDWFGTWDRPFVYVWLHDCGGITRVQVNADRVRITYPTEWALLEEDGRPRSDRQDSEHEEWHTYDCSDARGVQAEHEDVHTAAR